MKRLTTTIFTLITLVSFSQEPIEIIRKAGRKNARKNILLYGNEH